MINLATSLICALLFIIIVLVIVLLIVVSQISKIQKSSREEKTELKAENKDLLNRLLAKNTQEYKALSNITDKPIRPQVETLEEQLIRTGAMLPNGRNPYPNEL